MIRVDIPLPDRCAECRMSYFIRTGRRMGQMMCEAIEFRDKAEVDECLVDEFMKKRPEKCPIVE